MSKKTFLKWAGNKTGIIEEIKKILPRGNRLIEPCLGSGAVFFGTDYPAYLLGDCNEDLINLYRWIQVDVSKTLAAISELFVQSNNNESRFYDLRNEFNSTVRDTSCRKAALFMYMNKFGYRGLCRYNRVGGFNVPFGHYKTCPSVPEDEILAFSRKLKQADLMVGDFSEVMAQAQSGEAVYLDPPYVELAETANFTAFCKDAFTMDDQRRLVVAALDCANRRIPCVISNVDNETTRTLYAQANLIVPVQARRSIGQTENGRGYVGELLAIYY